VKQPKLSWDWLRTPSGEIGAEPQPAHLCVVLPDKRAVAICNHPFLSSVERVEEARNPEADFPKCDECLKIWKSGDAIAITDDSGAKLVVRPKVVKYSGGTLDPFIDAAEKLQALGVGFVLIVAIPEQPKMRYWSNMMTFGKKGVAEARRQTNEMFDDLDARLDALAKPDAES